MLTGASRREQKSNRLQPRTDTDHSYAVIDHRFAVFLAPVRLAPGWDKRLCTYGAQPTAQIRRLLDEFASKSPSADQKSRGPRGRRCQKYVCTPRKRIAVFLRGPFPFSQPMHRTLGAMQLFPDLVRSQLVLDRPVKFDSDSLRDEPDRSAPAPISTDADFCTANRWCGWCLAFPIC
jgi:hypothetical protein